MKQLLLFLLLIPFFAINQTINEVDENGDETGCLVKKIQEWKYKV